MDKLHCLQFSTASKAGIERQPWLHKTYLALKVQEELSQNYGVKKGRLYCSALTCKVLISENFMIKSVLRNIFELELKFRSQFASRPHHYGNSLLI